MTEEDKIKFQDWVIANIFLVPTGNSRYTVYFT